MVFNWEINPFLKSRVNDGNRNRYWGWGMYTVVLSQVVFWSKICFLGRCWGREDLSTITWLLAQGTRESYFHNVSGFNEIVYVSPAQMKQQLVHYQLQLGLKRLRVWNPETSSYWHLLEAFYLMGGQNLYSILSRVIKWAWVLYICNIQWMECTDEIKIESDNSILWW